MVWNLVGVGFGFGGVEWYSDRFCCEDKFFNLEIEESIKRFDVSSQKTLLFKYFGFLFLFL